MTDMSLIDSQSPAYFGVGDSVFRGGQKLVNSAFQLGYRTLGSKVEFRRIVRHGGLPVIRLYGLLQLKLHI